MIRPQLNFHQANNLPVYSTSHVFSGFVNTRTDHDIDNVTFGDMPWVLPKARPKIHSQVGTMKAKATPVALIAQWCSVPVWAEPLPTARLRSVR